MFKFLVGTNLVMPGVVYGQASVLEYDGNGNQIRDHNGQEYEYNDANQLVRVRDSLGGLMAEYKYDHEGKRIWERNENVVGFNDEDTYFSGSHEYYRYGTGIVWTGDTNYFRVNGETVARKNDDGSYTYYHNDHLSSPNLQTDGVGDVEVRQEYSPFGRPDPIRSSSAISYNNRVQFTGQREDRTGLNYYGARYYNSPLRRFTQPDPLLPDPYDPQQLNRYSYVRNNPLKYTDPSGNSIWESIYTFFNHPAVAPEARQMENTFYNTIETTQNVSQATLKSAPITGDIYDAYYLGKATGQAAYLVGGRNAIEYVEQNPETAVVGILPFITIGSSRLLKSIFSGSQGALESGSKMYLRGALNPAVAEAAAKGRNVHSAYASALKREGYLTEFSLPSGKRIDAIDPQRGIVRELKPSNQNAINRGVRQLDSYIGELSNMEDYQGIEWTGYIDTY